MTIKLIEDPLVCPACEAQMAGLGLHNRPCSSCAMQSSVETDETKRTDEQIRLLLSRDAVLRQLRPRELGGSRW
jgi:hypothetical protein